MSKLKTKVIRAPAIKNGAKGISVLIFIFFLDKNKTNNPTIDPIQNAKIIAKIPCDIPSIHPRPKTNLPSPRPIKRPFEKNQRITNGIAKSGPANNVVKVGSTKKEPNMYGFIKMEKNEIAIKIYTSLSGITL